MNYLSTTKKAAVFTLLLFIVTACSNDESTKTKTDADMSETTSETQNQDEETTTTTTVANTVTTSETPQVVDVAEFHAIVTPPQVVNFNDKEVSDAFMMSSFGKLQTFIQGGNVAVAGVPFTATLEWDQDTKTGNMQVGIPVASFPEEIQEGLEYKTYAAHKALKYTYKGAYEGLEAAYIMTVEYAKENNIQLNEGVGYEMYLTNPQELEDQNDNVTEIYLVLADEEV